MGATYRLFRSTSKGKRYLVSVHSHGSRVHKMVRSEQDAKALVQHIHKQELAGVNVIEAIRKARAAVAPAPATFPPLKEALPEWIDGQVAARELRVWSGKTYKQVLNRWLYSFALPDGRLLGDLPANLLTREQIGQVIRKIKEAGRSVGTITHLTNPLKVYYRHLIESKVLPPGSSPAADLRYFVGKARRTRGQALAFFTQEEGPKLLELGRARQATAASYWLYPVARLSFSRRRLLHTVIVKDVQRRVDEAKPETWGSFDMKRAPARLTGALWEVRLPRRGDLAFFHEFIEALHIAVQEVPNTSYFCVDLPGIPS